MIQGLSCNDIVFSIGLSKILKFYLRADKTRLFSGRRNKTRKILDWKVPQKKISQNCV